MQKKVIGVVCLAAGVVLLVWGYNMSQSVGSQIQNTFTGSPGDKPMYLYIGGAVLSAFGLFQILFSKK